MYNKNDADGKRNIYRKGMQERWISRGSKVLVGVVKEVAFRLNMIKKTQVKENGENRRMKLRNRKVRRRGVKKND